MPQLEREGRWWWEDAAAKECGLHSGNIKNADGTTTERKAERDLWQEGSGVAALSKDDVRAVLCCAACGVSCAVECAC
jgi:adenylyl-sulfate reductase (glutathione)